jgi:CheY-like chemotaxis protein
MAQLLVIDDEASIRQMARRILVASGHSVIEAENGTVGLAQLAQHRVDLVLTDIVMPGTEGIETIQQIRRLLPDMKIIAMSGSNAQNLYLKVAGKLGADEILNKPFRAAELRDAVSRILSN